MINLLRYFVVMAAVFPFSRQLFSCARDVITPDLPVQDGETIVSEGHIFELGFFTPKEGSPYERYVGIWFKFSPDTIVWVANRDDPVIGRNGTFKIRENSLQVYDESTGRNPWSATAIETSSDLTAKLMDSGNLMLGGTQWQSFNHPTDTFLPGMNLRKGLELVSWRREDNPACGDFSFTFDKERESQGIIENKSAIYWKSGGSFASLDKIPYFVTTTLSLVKATLPPHSELYNSTTRLVLMFNGTLNFLMWDKENKNWSSIWLEAVDHCSLYNSCGDFGSCNRNKAIPCKCLPGFKPAILDQWINGNFSAGCTRRSRECGKATFLNLTMMDLAKPKPVTNHITNETACMEECLESCQCRAYSFITADNSTLREGRDSKDAKQSSCSLWLEDLHDIQEEYAGGKNLFVRVAPSDLDDDSPTKKTPLALIIVPTVVCVAILACAFFTFIIWRRATSKIRGDSRISYRRRKVLHKLDTQNRIEKMMESEDFVAEDEEAIDVPFFSFESIVAATNDFSNTNKLGQGGYGPVYKGIFPGGQEVAVKRLSSVSGQGLREFKNEVVLIAKLQHRNLVQLRGYCVQGEEKILVYEYMPNKSLDSLLASQSSSQLLDWQTRFNIILGIGRGLLYLHQDSRFKIIHRDLKTSNILLDADMDPKISDFGLARIFGVKQSEAITNQIVGTYGYMSPEYAMEGIFSFKSDVFSFGVVLLEIISGKRNTRLVQSEPSVSLLGYAWRLWTENKVLDLIDPALTQSCREDQFVKCFKVSLLCVQEDPSERPTMSAVMTWLDSETETIPTPQHPAFVLRRGSNIASSSSSAIPEITVTYEDGR